MKKIRYLLILLLFIPVLNVKAEVSCGTYTYGQHSVTAYIEGNLLRIDTYPKVAPISLERQECPKEIYRWLCFSTYSYALTKPSTNGACEDAGTFRQESRELTTTPTPTPSSSTNSLTPSNKYENLDVCEGGPYKYIQKCGCMPAALTDLTSRVFNLIKIIAPALLIIVGGFDLIKAVTAADEKAIQKQQTKLIKKFVAAFTIFILFTLVQFVIGLVAKDKEGTIKCIEYIVNGWNGE